MTRARANLASGQASCYRIPRFEPEPLGYVAACPLQRRHGPLRRGEPIGSGKLNSVLSNLAMQSRLAAEPGALLRGGEPHKTSTVVVHRLSRSRAETADPPFGPSRLLSFVEVQEAFAELMQANAEHVSAGQAMAWSSSRSPLST